MSEDETGGDEHSGLVQELVGKGHGIDSFRDLPPEEEALRCGVVLDSEGIEKLPGRHAPALIFGVQLLEPFRTLGQGLHGRELEGTVDNDANSPTFGQAFYQNAVLDANGVPVLKYPYNLMTQQESLVATNPLNRFIIDASVGKLLYLPNRQSLSINLSVSNLTNNTHFKTGGYQQARLPRAVRQQQPDNQNSVITANAWKYPSKYYYAWGVNFFLSVTYKF